MFIQSCSQVLVGNKPIVTLTCWPWSLTTNTQSVNASTKFEVGPSTKMAVAAAEINCFCVCSAGHAADVRNVADINRPELPSRWTHGHPACSRREIYRHANRLCWTTGRFLLDFWYHNIKNQRFLHWPKLNLPDCASVTLREQWCVLFVFKSGFHCRLCGKHSNSERQWQQHISTEKHKDRVFSCEGEDEALTWSYRFPGTCFELCPK